MQSLSLPQLGWSHFFQQQMDLEELDNTLPVRVSSVHKGAVEVMDPAGTWLVHLPGSWASLDPVELPAVGDWLLLDPARERPLRVLERKSLITRRAAGRESREQPFAANLDILFLVTSCDRDFNPSRLERYLSLALQAGVTPVAVLTKADLVDDPGEYARRAGELLPGLAVETVNCLERDTLDPLLEWCGAGRTVALAGSSGVGKTTLVNALCGQVKGLTAGLREKFGKGRHTTTVRTLHPLPSGGLLLDSPGMRELALSQCREGVESLFADIEELALGCRFKDCTHTGEAGCAVALALEQGRLDPRRLASHRKLLAEERHNSLGLAERREKDKTFGKMCREVMKEKRRGRRLR